MEKIFGVVVTYGDRRKSAECVIARVLDLAVNVVILVNNGASWDVHSALSGKYGDRLEIVDIGLNSGSAYAFGIGISRAIARGALYVWTLDDDGVPDVDCLDKLTSCLEDLEGARGFRPTVAIPTRLTALADNQERQIHFPRRSSFNGFHYLDFIAKIGRRIKGAPRLDNTQTGGKVLVPLAPYGGALFSSKIVTEIGLPNPDFVLYWDDYEWFSRLSTKNGEIWHARSATIRDDTPSWDGRGVNRFVGALTNQGNSVAYYSIRNGIYFSLRNWRAGLINFLINGALYLVVLIYFGVKTQRVDRLILLLRGVYDGMLGRLGLNGRYPL